MIKAHIWGDDPAKPPLLLIHGMLTSSRHWLINREALCAHFTPIAIDLPGHGQAPAPEDVRSITAAALIAALEDLRRDLGYQRWFICGQSFGGALSLNYALAHPDRIIAQVFTNARTPLRQYADPAEMAGRQARLKDLHRRGHDALREEFFHPRNARRFAPDLREMLVAEADAIDINCYIQLLDQVIPSLSLWPVEAHPPKVPSLLINGRHERLFQSYRGSIGQSWPSLQIVDLDGGHSVNIENPDGFAQAVTAFCGAHAISADAPAPARFRA